MAAILSRSQCVKTNFVKQNNLNLKEGNLILCEDQMLLCLKDVEMTVYCMSKL